MVIIHMNVTKIIENYLTKIYTYKIVKYILNYLNDYVKLDNSSILP